MPLSDAAEVLVPSSEADVARMAQIQALRVMSDTQRRTNETLDKISEKVNALAQDMAALRAVDHSRDIEALRAHFDAQLALVREDNKARDDRIEKLLAESLEDRKALWLAVSAAKTEDAKRQGEIKNLSDRVIPIFSAISAGVAVLVAILLEKLLK